MTSLHCNSSLHGLPINNYKLVALDLRVRLNPIVQIIKLIFVHGYAKNYKLIALYECNKFL